MLKQSLLILTAHLTILGYCDEDQVCCLVPPNPVESCQLPVGYFYPAQYNLNNSCINYSVFGQFILWEVNFDQTHIANRASGPALNIDGAPTGTENLLEFLAHNSGYRPGFIVGIGLGFPSYDHWQFSAEYTRIHSTTTNHFNARPDGVLTTPVFLQLAFLPTSSVKSVQTLNLDFLSGTLGRDVYLSQRFVIRPFVGVKGWWATQKQKLLYTITNPFFPPDAPEFQITSCKVWGIGPYLGTYIDALLWCGISVIGRAGILPIYTRTSHYQGINNFSITLNPTFFPFLVNEERIHGKFFNTQLFYEASVGLQYGTYFCDCGYHIDLSVGWDFMTTWENAYVVASGTALREFYYQGFFAKVKFDF